ncbi:MAG: M48 family metalloprotease [Lachnospiraceae bacterium]|nr:M48 family metalloprotease [Lachnospiraceae bacterium]
MPVKIKDIKGTRIADCDKDEMESEEVSIEESIFRGFVIMSAIIWPLSTVMSMLGNYLSRKNEYRADAFAAKEGYGKDLISALKRLSKESFSHINPHPAKVILDYSHPTLSQRITAIESEIGPCGGYRR